MRIAVYVRVSTPNQVHSQTIDQQLDRVRQHVAQQPGWELRDEQIFRDDGYSGASLSRPGLDRLRDAVREREIDRLVVTAPDRLARNYVHQMVLLEELERQGCLVEFLDHPMSQDPHDHLLLQIRGAVAEYERTLITERMRRGRLAKLRAGVLLPWTRPPYAYRLHPERPREPAGVQVEPAEAAVVATIFATYLEPGASLEKVAHVLHDQQICSPRGQLWWGLSTLRGILQNPTYTGQVYAGRTRTRPPRIRRSATHRIGRPHDSLTPVPPEEWIAVAQIPALVSEEQFALVHAKLAQNQSFARRHNTTNTYLLRALVSCGHCQLACTARSLKPRHAYYVCSGKAKPTHSHREVPCASRFIPAHQLDALVWQDLCELLLHPERLAAARERAHAGQWLPQELQARREGLHKGRRSVQQQRDRLTDAYLHGVIPLSEYERRRRDLDQKDQALADQEQQVVQQAERHHEVAGVAANLDDFCQRVQAGLANATFEQRRQLVELLVDRVVVTDDDVEIRYVFPTQPSSEHVRFCHLRTDYFRAPHGIGGGNGAATQQVGIALRAIPTCAGYAQPGIERFQAHEPQQPSHPLVVDDVALLAQPSRHAPDAVEGRLGVLLVHLAHQLQVLRALAVWRVVPTRPRHAQQRAWPRDTQLRVRRLNERPRHGQRLLPFFRSQSTATLSWPICG
jgi:site-specific DNA recombinase